MSFLMVGNVRVLIKGQITIPKDIRKYLNINTDDRLTLIGEKDRLILVKSEMFADEEFRENLLAEAKKAGAQEDDAIERIEKMRREGNKEKLK